MNLKRKVGLLYQRVEVLNFVNKWVQHHDVILESVLVHPKMPIKEEERFKFLFKLSRLFFISI